jgi:hypothetical protein
VFELPGISALRDQVAGDLRNGKILLFKGLPRSGRTALVRAVQRAYDDTSDRPAVSLHLSTRSDPELIAYRLRDAVTKHGHAAVLIDDWGTLLRSQQGGMWQSRLRMACVDWPEASGVGALIVSGVGEDLSRSGVPGSPLADAANVVLHWPLPSQTEIVGSLLRGGWAAEEARTAVAQYGAHPELLNLSTTGVLPANTLSNTVLSVVGAVGAEGAARLLDLGRKPDAHLATETMDGLLVAAVYSPSPGRTALVAALRDAGLLGLLPGGMSRWPETMAESVRRFHARIYGKRDLIWSDRYIGYNSSALARFLDDLSVLGQTCWLRLLSRRPPAAVAGSAERESFTGRLPIWKHRGLEVSWHTYNWNDDLALHDRQLLAVDRRDGYHLPPVDRMVGVVHPGNENDAYLPRIAVNHVLDVWARSRCYACLRNRVQH